MRSIAVSRAWRTWAWSSGGFARVENDEVVARIAHFLQREARILSQDVVGAQRKIILVDVVDLTGLQRKQARRSLGNDLDDDAVEIGLSLSSSSWDCGQASGGRRVPIRAIGMAPR